MSPWIDRPGGGRRWRPKTWEEKSASERTLPSAQKQRTSVTTPVQAAPTPTQPTTPKIEAGAGMDFATDLQQPETAAKPQAALQTPEEKTGIWNWIKNKAMEWGRFTNPTISAMGEAAGLLPERTIGQEVQTALEMTGTTLLAGAILKAAAYKSVPIITEKIATNPKTMQIVGTEMTKLLSVKTVTTLTALGLGVGTIGGITFASFWGKAETIEPFNMISRKILDEANFNPSPEAWALYDEVIAAKKDFYETMASEDKMSWIPFIGAVKNAIAKGKAGLEASLLEEKLAALTRRRQETGETEEEADRREREEWAAERKQDRDDYNADRIATEKIILDLKALHAQTQREKYAIAQRRERAADLRFIREQIKLWEAHKIKMLELQKIENEKAQKFWLNYLKLKFEMQESMGRSHLGFGLLR